MSKFGMAVVAFIVVVIGCIVVFGGNTVMNATGASALVDRMTSTNR